MVKRKKNYHNFSSIFLRVHNPGEHFYLNLLGKGVSSIQNTVHLDGFPFLESAKQNLVPQLGQKKDKFVRSYLVFS